jgi:hypothetical protein
MSAHLYCGLYQGGLGWYCGLASEFELAHSGEVHPANSPWLGHGASASDRAQHLALQTPTYRRTPSKKRIWSILWWSGTVRGHISCICCGMHCTSLYKPDVTTVQAATFRSSKSASLPPKEHAYAFWHQEMHFIRYSELGFWSHTGLNLAHGIIATLSGDMHVLTHRPVCRGP